jgi:taurine dioxygenase
MGSIAKSSLSKTVPHRHHPAADARASKIEVQPIAGAIGAEILGPDLSRPLSDSEFADIHQAFLAHLVIFFRNQKPIAPEQQTAFAGRFGEVDRAPFTYPFKTPTVAGHPQILVNLKEAEDRSFNVGGFWHADVTYRERPHKAAVLYAHDVPPYGGDTMFANQYLAYETLSEGMQRLLAGMRAVHGSDMRYGQEPARFASVSRGAAPRPEDRSFAASRHSQADDSAPIENDHPVIRTHPETGRKSLYVNRGFVSRFVGMTVEESRSLLEDLWNHAAQAEFTCRFRWAPHDVGVWDNRCALHYALNDYSGARREMRRVSVHEATRPT